jgi:ATP-dependent RNA helicase RhlE
LHTNLVRAIADLGFVRPTLIQTDAIPAALTGRDILASAETGSGKTASFLLPILNNLIDKPRGTTRALVLVPTRELASQVHGDLRDLARHTPVTGAAIFGGVSHGPQTQAFRRGVDIVIATPGRLLDHLRDVSLDRLEYLVLDEADRMLDMGFLPEIRKILRHLPAKRQTLFFSATMPPPIKALTAEMLKDPIEIRRERKSVTPTGITQAVYPIAQDLKAALLVELLNRGEMTQALVFTRTKHRANRLFELLSRQGIRVDRIHGNRSQGQREKALRDFKAGRCAVLVATDIVARGIDVEDLGHVVNFDVPVVPEDYIHRIGRTGRAEATGEAFTFVAPDERGHLADIERALKKTLPRVTLPNFDTTTSAEKLEVPLAQRIAEIRARKAEERRRAEINRARRNGPHAAAANGRGTGPRRAASPQHAPRPNRADPGPKHAHPHGPKPHPGRPHGPKAQGSARVHGLPDGQGRRSGDWRGPAAPAGVRRDTEDRPGDRPAPGGGRRLWRHRGR